MAKWEYTILTIDTDIRSKFYVKEIDGKRVDKGPSLSETLNRFGTEGWELVTTRAGFDLILKRQIT